MTTPLSVLENDKPAPKANPLTKTSPALTTIDQEDSIYLIGQLMHYCIMNQCMATYYFLFALLYKIRKEHGTQSGFLFKDSTDYITIHFPHSKDPDLHIVVNALMGSGWCQVHNHLRLMGTEDARYAKDHGIKGFEYPRYNQGDGSSPLVGSSTRDTVSEQLYYQLRHHSRLNDPNCQWMFSDFLIARGWENENLGSMERFHLDGEFCNTPDLRSDSLDGTIIAPTNEPSDLRVRRYFAKVGEQKYEVFPVASGLVRYENNFLTFADPTLLCPRPEWKALAERVYYQILRELLYNETRKMMEDFTGNPRLQIYTFLHNARNLVITGYNQNLGAKQNYDQVIEQ